MFKKNIFRILLGALFISVAVIDYLQNGGVQGITLATVVVGGQYTDAMTHARRILSAKAHKLVWYKSKWSKFISLMDKDKFKKNNSYAGSTMFMKPSGNLITMYKEFDKQGGIYMDIPVTMPLTGLPTYGGKRLRGNEELRKVFNKKLAINTIRHAVQIKDGAMSKQVLQKPELQASMMERGSADLADWLSRWTAFQPYYALLERYSKNLTDSEYGVNLSMNLHPNYYIEGIGRVTFSNTVQTFTNSVIGALAGIGQTSDYMFSTRTIKNMVYLASNVHNIEPIKYGESEIYIIFVSPSQARQLQDDENWKNAQFYSAERGDKNALFTGKVEGKIYAGALVIVDNHLPSIAYDDNAMTVTHGNTSYLASPVSTGDLFPALLVGQDALSIGTASAVEYDTEIDDYNAFLGDSISQIIGFERSDIIDSDGYVGTAGNLYGNFSSLQYVTYSPYDLTF